MVPIPTTREPIHVTHQQPLIVALDGPERSISVAPNVPRTGSQLACPERGRASGDSRACPRRGGACSRRELQQASGPS